MKKIVDGNEACASVAYLFSEMCPIYPITPSTPMATLCEKWSSEGKLNLFGYPVKVVEMQSEAGASGLMHGMLQGGTLATTFTSSQGLLLMIPSMYKMSGELLPGVIHTAARSLSTHALSIFGDHQDVYAVRSTGFTILSSSNVQDAYYLAIVAHLTALSSSIPLLHFFDGFRTSHEINKINVLEENDIKKLLNKKDVKNFKDRSLNIQESLTRGTSQTEEIYFENTEARNKLHSMVPDIVNEKMQLVNELAGTDYKPFNYYGSKSATKVIIAMGSVTDTIKEVIDNENNSEYGLINIHLFKPFSKEYFLKALPKTVKKIAVLDRSKETNGTEECLLEVTNILKDKDIKIIGGRYGLSSKDTTPADIKAVFDNLEKENPQENFTLGIKDDVTFLNLKTKKYEIKNNYKEVKVFGFGSDGMVGACKNVLKTLGQNEEKYVQGYFKYDSKKSGGVTESHLRISKTPINAPYYITNPDLVVVTKIDYLNNLDVLKGIKDNATLILNTNKTDTEINKYLKDEPKEIIKDKNIRFLVSKAEMLADEFKMKGRINNIMASYMLKLLDASIEDMNAFKDIIKETYKDKGESVIKNNINLVDEAFSYIREFDKSLFTFDYTDKEIKEDVRVSDFLNNIDGSFDGGISGSAKAKTSELVPKWDKEKCIECNLCSLLCPHSVIRPFSFEQNELKDYRLSTEETINSMGEANKEFFVGVSEENCTGCGLCISACPGKGGEKALSFGEFNKALNDRANKIFKNKINNTSFNKYTIKGSMFNPFGLEFPGACAGCGESAYLKILTSLFNKEIVIANATGCSSIYGGSLPNTPYSIPWINSLFEDNAEFSFGLYLSLKQKKERIKEIMFETRDEVSKEMKSIFKTWIDNMYDEEITRDVYEQLKNTDEPLDKELISLLKYIPSKEVWTVGGDGWAYDIGYGGLDHVLHTNERVRVLILDTEVYSNTGGQNSKSSKEGSSHEFSTSGKRQNKKDLFKILMSIPNVYVASVSLKASPMQTLNAFKEAHTHDGPAVIIAYSPCIEHGLKGGLGLSLEEEKDLVASGYNILMRYNPVEKKLTIDSKEPDFSLYEDIFKKELRYKKLVLKNEDYQKLYDANIDEAKKRYEYYKNLSEKC